VSGRVLIDTNAYAALMAGSADVADVLSESEAVLLSAVVVGELPDGFVGGAREQENRRDLRRFRAKPRTVLVPVTDETAEWFAVLKQQLRRKGTPVPISDVWIAATCMEHGAASLSFDGHFRDIDGLRIVAIEAGG
jgi:tRNA(fMet)-specific endonuclease VapC